MKHESLRFRSFDFSSSSKLAALKPSIDQDNYFKETLPIIRIRKGKLN